jgi:hypothetical protein
MADAIAQSLAQKRIRRVGEVRRSFCFAGHSLLFRELDLLRAARMQVDKVLQQAEEVLWCSHRATQWNLIMSKIPSKIRRSGYLCPAQLSGPARSYFAPAAHGVLREWYEQARMASEVRHAAILEDYDHARFLNNQNFKQQFMKSGGTPDQRTLHSALRKRQPSQKMWGLSAQCRVKRFWECHSGLTRAVCRNCRMPTVAKVMRAIRDPHELQLGFRGPRQAGGFLAGWVAAEHNLCRFEIRALTPPEHYEVPRRHALQEWHMTSEGMDTASICPQCAAKGIQPITITASPQPNGNSRRECVFSTPTVSLLTRRWHCPHKQLVLFPFLRCRRCGPSLPVFSLSD